MIVADASIVVEFLLGTEAGQMFAQTLLDTAQTLHAPHVLDVEVTHALRGAVMRGEVEARRAREALDDLRDLRVTRYPHVHLLPRMWELRKNLTAYDAAYVALAEALDAELVTRDAGIAEAPRHSAKVTLIEPVD